MDLVKLGEREGGRGGGGARHLLQCERGGEERSGAERSGLDAETELPPLDPLKQPR